jgi:hypothetical protein
VAVAVRILEFIQGLLAVLAVLGAAALAVRDLTEMALLGLQIEVAVAVGALEPVVALAEVMVAPAL